MISDILDIRPHHYGQEKRNKYFQAKILKLSHYNLFQEAGNFQLVHYIYSYVILIEIV